MRAEDNIIQILCISERCRDKWSPVFCILLCSKAPSEERHAQGVSEKRDESKWMEPSSFLLRPTKIPFIFPEACICLQETIQTLFPLKRSLHYAIDFSVENCSGVDCWEWHMVLRVVPQPVYWMNVQPDRSS